VTSGFYLLVVGVLAVWRITHLLQAEDGPWDLVLRLRRRVGDSVFGQLLDCFYCLSLYVALPFAWLCGASWLERLLLWPALSAGAILLERIGGTVLAPTLAPPVPGMAGQADFDEPGREKKEF
jgi:hypothetical protein